MGYGDLDPVGDEPPAPARDLLSVVERVLAVLVRLLGIAILLVGLWTGVKVLLEGWALYESPERIERLAVAIEQGSNLDALFATVAPAADEPVVLEASDELPVATPARTRPAGPSLRLSYFAAWFVALMLLLVLGLLATSAISAGGQLALREPSSPRARRPVARETRGLRRAA